MPAPRSERKTQNRVVELFEKQLGYDNLGEWGKRENNRNIEVEYLRANLQQRGYSDVEINAAVFELQKAGDVVGTTLYNANLKIYELLRYGVPVQVAAGEAHKQVHLIDQVIYMIWRCGCLAERGRAPPLSLAEPGHSRKERRGQSPRCAKRTLPHRARLFAPK